MTITEFVEFTLRKKVRQLGSVKAVAEWIGCSDVYIHQVLKRKADPGQKILDAFGKERVTVIRNKR